MAAKKPKFDGPIAFFDVDDTLVSWKYFNEFKEGMIEFIDPYDDATLYLEPIKETIEQLKTHKLRHHKVVVWSAGGAEWAEEVAIKLGIDCYVDLYLSKPSWFYDDLPASEFMPEHIRKDMRPWSKKKN